MPRRQLCEQPAREHASHPSASPPQPLAVLFVSTAGLAGFCLWWNSKPKVAYTHLLKDGPSPGYGVGRAPWQAARSRAVSLRPPAAGAESVREGEGAATDF